MARVKQQGPKFPPAPALEVDSTLRKRPPPPSWPSSSSESTGRYPAHQGQKRARRSASSSVTAATTPPSASPSTSPAPTTATKPAKPCTTPSDNHPIYLLSTSEAREVLHNPTAALKKGPYYKLPPPGELYYRLFADLGRSSIMPAVLPQGESYALIEGKLGRVTAVNKMGAASGREWTKVQVPSGGGGGGEGGDIMRSRRGGESRGEALLSEFKAKSAAIKSGTDSSESRSQSPTIPLPIKLEPGLPPQPPPQKRRRAAPKPIPSPTESVRSDLAPAAAIRSEDGQHGSLDVQALNKPTARRGYKRKSLPQSQSQQTQTPPVDDSPSAASKSPGLTEFANRLSLLAAALYKATEVLPQQALLDLEGVLGNDWEVENMQKMVTGVIGLVDGRGEDGEKHWRSGSGGY